MEADKVAVQQSGSSTSEPDVNQKFSADGGTSIFSAEGVDGGKESGADCGVGSAGVSRKPFSGMK